MIDELIKRVFETCNAAHKAHWETNSYAQHAALGEFYEDAYGVLDKYVEACRGACGTKGSDQKAIIEDLHEQVVWITKNKAEIAKNIPALENILDELSAVYLRALYKLENLR